VVTNIGTKTLLRFAAVTTLFKVVFRPPHHAKLYYIPPMMNGELVAVVPFGHPIAGISLDRIVVVVHTAMVTNIIVTVFVMVMLVTFKKAS
jgi:hypothetical protein